MRRILDATWKVIADKGPSTRLADVARLLGVTRQTVYRYFPGIEALLMAAADDAAGTFLDQISAHVRGITDPAEFVVEGVAYTVETLPGQPAVEALLEPRNVGALLGAITSDVALAHGRAMLRRSAVDWRAAGLDDAGLDELTETMLRAVQSFVTDPGRPARTGPALRTYLRRWMLPAELTESAAPTAAAHVRSSRRRTS